MGQTKGNWEIIELICILEPKFMQQCTLTKSFSVTGKHEPRGCLVPAATQAFWEVFRSRKSEVTNSHAQNMHTFLSSAKTDSQSHGKLKVELLCQQDNERNVSLLKEIIVFRREKIFSESQSRCGRENGGT